MLRFSYKRFISFGLLISNCLAIIDQTLIVKFFQFKSIQSGYVFDCLPLIEKLQLRKFLMGNYLQISENSMIEDLTLINTQLNRHYGIIVDGDCINADNLLKKAEKLMLFDDTQHWLVMASNNSILRNFANLALNINSNIYVALPDNTNSNNKKKWGIIDVYNPAYKHGGELKTESVGFYSTAEGLKVARNSNKYWVRRNMTGATFKVMVVLRQAANMTLKEFLYGEKNRKTDSFVRFQCRLIHYCQEMYNFSMEIIPTNTWGYEYAKGKFDGLTGALQNRQVDFGCSGLYVKPERLSILDFAAGFWTFREIFVFRQPRKHSFGRLFVRPMSPSVWYTMLAAALLILFTLKVSQKHEGNIVEAGRDSLDQGWSTLVLFILGAICQQGCHQYPSLICGRIITISVLIFCVLFYQFYSGTVVSFLLTKPPPTIKTPKDLVEHPIEVGSEDSSYIRDYFQTTKDPIAIELYRTKIMESGRKPNYFPPEYGLELVERGDFAYQLELNAGYTIISNTFSNKAVCELGQVEMFPPKVLLTVLQKNSPFRDMLNYCMLRLDEQGIGDRQKIFWSARKPKCLESRNSVKIEVDLKGIYPAILFLFVGIVVSFIVLSFEILTSRIVKRKFQIKQSEYPLYN